MTGLLSKLLGAYHMQFVIHSSSLVLCLCCTLLFASTLRRQGHFILRFMIGLVLYLAFYYGIAVIRTDYASFYSRLLTNIMYYFAALPILFLCYKEDVASIILCWCATMATQEIGSKGFSILLNLFGVNDQASMSFFVNSEFNEFRDWSIYFLIHFLIYFACFHAFRPSERINADRKSMISITMLSVFSLLFLSVISGFIREYQSQSHMLYIVTLIYSLVFAFFILLLRTGILSQSQYRLEISLMEQMLNEERKQYQASKESIDIINIKCHDLKHQLSALSGKLTDQEIAVLQEAIKIYDSNIKTGNEVLDVILYEKQLVCQKENIQLSCIANGEVLSFMRTSHIYSMFNNAISNAMEAVHKVENPEKRIISIAVNKIDNNIDICITNYFEGTRQIANGLPVTTKENRNQHGFGVMSIKYITEFYRGTLEISVDKDIFTLHIHIPIPKQ